MKSTLSSLLFILMTNCAFGQTLKTGFLKNDKQVEQHRLAIMQFMREPANVASKSTSTKERVISYNYLFFNPFDHYVANDMDTIYLTYSGNRGSEFDYNNLSYNFHTNPYDSLPMFEFDDYVNKPQVLSDTLIEWGMASPENVFSSYDTNNNLISSTGAYRDTFDNHNIKYLNTFNSDNNITASYSFLWSGSNWDSLKERYFSYNTSRLLIQDSTYIKDSTGWSSAYKNVYTYSASGDLVRVDNYNYSLSWIMTIEYVNEYNSSHQLVSVVTNMPSSPATYVDSFFYMPGISYPLSWTEYSAGSIERCLKHFNVSGLPDTVYTGYWNTIKNNWIANGANKAVLNYDTYNEPITAIYYDYLDTSFDTIPTTQENFHYETYVATSVKNVINQDYFTIYPNPTTDKLFISQKNAVAAKSLQISIVNVSGQRILTESLPATNKTEEISLAGFVPGTYWLTIQDQSGNILHKQSIVKQ